MNRAANRSSETILSLAMMKQTLATKGNQGMTNPDPVTNPNQSEGGRIKYVVDDVPVYVLDERVQVLWP